jgi:ubiquinone/menaquinone biosynthesis C-methylase UbiE
MLTLPARSRAADVKGVVDLNSRRAFFESLAESWDAQQPPDRDEVLGQMLAPFEGILRGAHAILEVGTGTGALIPRLREKAPAAWLVSIDLAHAMLKRAQRRCPGALLVQADIHHLPFPSASARAGLFDLVVCHNSFPHFADPPAALGEIARALCPGGCLLILHDLSRGQVNAIHRNGGVVIQNDLLPPGDELHHLLVDVGLSGVQVQDADSYYMAIGHRNKVSQTRRKELQHDM